MSSTVDNIKSRLGIAEVVSSYIKLEKAGVNLKAKCPFHNEKTPSFNVSPSRNSYYCFGCGAKGDIFSFIEQFEGVDFRGALKILADRAGVEIVPERREVRDARDRSFALLEEATLHFERNIQREKDVRAYLLARGLSPKTIRVWRIGFAKDDWHDLSAVLKKAGFSHQELQESGLAVAGPKGLYDRFRSRIMFPLSDTAGRIIAFSGRIFDVPRALSHGTEAKYVNSPETPLFSKSHVLYGYAQGKLMIRKWNFSVVVEGQVDLIMSHQTGYANTVAPSGTALTKDQLLLLSRLSSNVVLAFDTDSAGLAAARKGALLALSLGMDVKIAAMPLDRDPAELILEDKERWKEAIKKAQHAVDFFLDVLAAQKENTRAFRKDVSESVLPLVGAITNNIDRAHFVTVVASRLHIDADAVRDELKRIMAKKDTHGEKEAIVEKKQDTSSEKDHTSSVLRMVRSVLVWQETLPDPAIDIVAVEKRLAAICGGKYAGPTDSVLSREEQIFEAEEEFSSIKDIAFSVEEMLARLEKESLADAYAHAKNRLHKAEQSGNTKEIAEALQACNDVSKQLAGMKHL